MNQRDDENILRIQMGKKSRQSADFMIYENQEKSAEKIQTELNNPSVVSVLVVGKTQVGKTGCMLAFVHHHVLSVDIPIGHIFIITPLSDKQWKQDTKRRMPDCLNEQVFHRPNLHKRDFINKIKNMKNVLIIMDEIQIASAENQTIDVMFKECNLHDMQHVFKNDIKFVQFTATPDGHAEDMRRWGDNAKTVLIEPGKGYTGIDDLYKNGSIKQAEDLKCKDAVSRFGDIIKSKYGNEDHRYHIMRIPSSKYSQDSTVIQNVVNELGNEFDYVHELLKKDKININEILSTQPNKHTCVFVKETLRCAKTLDKKFIGIVYDRQTHSDSSIVQSLAGRLTGYDTPSDVICFTQVSSVEKYISNFSAQNWENWNVNNETYNSPSLKSGGNFVVPIATKKLKPQNEEYVFEEFSTQEAAIQYGHVKGKKILKRKEGQCPKELLVSGELPTKEYLMKRKWGLKGGNFRMVPIKNGHWVVYHKK